VILDEGDSQSASRDAFLLGDICIDPFGLEIRRSGSTQRVEAKVMEVLLALARQSHQVLSREELEQEVWGGRVVTDDALTNAISKLRRALEDNPRQPRFIETIAKRGYRLNVSPTPIAGDVAAGTATRGTKVARQPLRRSWVLAGALLAALTGLLAVWFWESSEPTIPSSSEGDRAIPLAVIPFDVLGDDPSQTYFAEGISLDLITELSRVPGLLVIAPGTVFSYRDTEADDRRIASELGVRYLIRGGVQRIGERIRINVRVLDTDGGQTRWAERFVGEAERLFRIQDQVVQGIARGLPGRLELPERTADRRGATESITAYDEFLRGLDYFGRRSPENRVRTKLM
jgi:adenylate cyclase